MSLLPRALQFRDEALSLPLGAAKREEPSKALAFDAAYIFETGDHKLGGITEADCRQIKGAAQASQVVSAALAVPVAAPPSPATPVAVPTFKVGDHIRIKGLDDDGYTRIVCELLEGGYLRYTNDGVVQTLEPHQDECELIPSEPKEADGWIEWKGGAVPGDQRMEMRFADSTTWTGYPSTLSPHRWTHTVASIFNENDFIVAYRLVKQQ